MKRERGNAAVTAIVVALVLGGLIGWVANIVKLIGMDWAAGLTGWFVARFIGIFAAPLGAVLGYF